MERDNRVPPEFEPGKRLRLERREEWHRARPLRVATAVLPLLTLLGCQSAGGPSLVEIAPEVNASLDPDTVLLAVGDMIEVRFPYSPDWNQELEITIDGSASFMSIGRLIVAGMTLGQLRVALEEAYSKVFEDPKLDVVLRTRGARMVYVMGEVLEPGEYELRPDRRLTLLDAVARAGGPIKETAYLAHTLLIRWSAGTGSQMSWTIDARERHWKGAEPVYLQQYDLVYIPNTPIDDVAIWIDNYIRRMIPFPYIFPPL